MMLGKVRIVWEGHKIWKNLSLKIWCYLVTSNFKWKIKYGAAENTLKNNDYILLVVVKKKHFCWVLQIFNEGAKGQMKSERI